MANHRFPKLGSEGYASPYSDIDYSKGPKVIYGDTDVMRLILNDPQTDEDDEWGRTEHIALRQLTDEAITVRKALFGWSSIPGILDDWNDFETNHFKVDPATSPSDRVFNIGDTSLTEGLLTLASGTSFSSTEISFNSELFKAFRVGTTLGWKIQSGDNSGAAGDVVLFMNPAPGATNSDAYFQIIVNNAVYQFSDTAFSMPTGASVSAGDLTLSGDLTTVNALVSGTLTVGTSSTTITTDSLNVDDGFIVTLTSAVTQTTDIAFVGDNAIQAYFDGISSSILYFISEEFGFKFGSTTVLSMSLTGARTSVILDADTLFLNSENYLNITGSQAVVDNETITVKLFGGSYTQDWVFNYTNGIGTNIYLPSSTRFGINSSLSTDSVALISDFSGSGTGISIKSTAYGGVLSNLVINATIQGTAPGPYGLFFENGGSSSPEVVFDEMPVRLWKSTTDTFLYLTHEEFHLTTMLKVSYSTGTDEVYFDLGGSASGFARLSYNPDVKVGRWDMNSFLIGSDVFNYAGINGGSSPSFTIKQQLSGEDVAFRIEIADLISGLKGLRFSDVSATANKVIYIDNTPVFNYIDSDNYFYIDGSSASLKSGGVTVARMSSSGFATEKGDHIKWQLLAGTINVPVADGSDDFPVDVGDELDPTTIIGISASLPDIGNPDTVGAGALSYSVRYDATGGSGNHKVYFYFPASHGIVASGNRLAYVTVFYAA